MLRRLLILLALVAPLPAAVVAVGGSAPVSAARVGAHTGVRSGPRQQGPVGYTFCVAEGGSCSFSGLVDVAFGAGSNFFYKYGQMSPVTCSNAAFGGDPQPGVVKACYVRAAGPAGYSYCVGENGTCSFGGHADVAFGANGNFFYKYGQASPVTCSNAAFGGDPQPGIVKACYVRAAGPPGYTYCAQENGACVFGGLGAVAYGAGANFFYKFGQTSPVTCSNAAFGGDPLPGIVKACYFRPQVSH